MNLKLSYILGVYDLEYMMGLVTYEDLRGRDKLSLETNA